MKITRTTTVVFTPGEIEDIVLDYLKGNGIDVKSYTIYFKLEDVYDTYLDSTETDFKGLEIKIEEVKE